MIWFWLLTFVVCIVSLIYAIKKSKYDFFINTSIISLVFLVICGFIDFAISMDDGARIRDYQVEELLDLREEKGGELAKQTYVKYGYITQGIKRQINQYAWQVLLSRKTGQAMPQLPIIVDPTRISVAEYIYLTIVWIGILTQITMLFWIKIKVSLENKVKKRLLDESENAEEFVKKIRQELELESS